MTNGTHNICKVTVNGKLTYELWIKGGERLGIFNSFNEANGCWWDGKMGTYVIELERGDGTQESFQLYRDKFKEVSN